MRVHTLRHYPPLLLILASSLLLSLAWYAPFLSLGLFVGFVPLLYLEAQLRASNTKYPKWRLFGWSLLSFILWNTATTWWVYNASPEGAYTMVIANSLLMTLPFVLYSFTKKVLGENYGLFGWLLYWLSFEYIHLNWDLNWPWLNVGNGFAYNPAWVQWYEYTGALGGTLWVLAGNIFFYKLLKASMAHNRRVFAIYSSVLIILPIAFSYSRYFTYEEVGEDFEVVVVQPNIDPYQEKFKDSPNFIPFHEQINRFIRLSEKSITPNTQLIAWPETAIDDALPEDRIQYAPVIKKVNKFLEKHPQTSLITGLTSVNFYKDKQTPTARFRQGLGYYDVFNTAFFMNPSASTTYEFYHKSKLVPGVESMPYPEVLDLLGSLVIDLGGTAGGLGKQAERSLFIKDSVKVAPLICYESIFGDFVGDYKGANVLCIITNDGWWGNTPGHRQHLHYASLRAIELRKDIARSANTGISCFINQRGDILQATNYWEQASIRATLKANDKQTLYATYGDYLGRVGSFIAAFFLLGTFVRTYTRKVGL
ncbi:MAG: apolipoprotein N-acyltransferase [Thermonemataceae bacterium]